MLGMCTTSRSSYLGQLTKKALPSTTDCRNAVIICSSQCDMPLRAQVSSVLQARSAMTTPTPPLPSASSCTIAWWRCQW